MTKLHVEAEFDLKGGYPRAAEQDVRDAILSNLHVPDRSLNVKVTVAKPKLPTEDGTVLYNVKTGSFWFVRLGGSWREIDNMFVPDEIVERYFDRGVAVLRRQEPYRS